MPEIINIEIIEKHATTLGAPVIVCGNAGYSLQFSFDSEWDGLDPKIARFVYVSNGLTQCEEVEFTGDTVEVPALINTREVMVGVYTDTLCTSTPARVPCELSIRCFAAEPATNSGGGNTGGGVTDYNDLTNKPITYLPYLDLDELTEPGIYVAKHSNITVREFQLVIVRMVFSAIEQIVWGPYSFQQRLRVNGEWSELNSADYQTRQETVLPLAGAEVDGVTAYNLDIGATALQPYFSAEISNDCTFTFPTVAQAQGMYSNAAICVYAKFTAAVSVDWGADVLFYDGQVPVIEPGYYDIIFTFDPNAEKWCVGVICKGGS